MAMHPFMLTNKTIVVTGASSGIGRACAFECAKQGAQIIALGRNKQKLELLMEELKEISKQNPDNLHSYCILDLSGDLKEFRGVIDRYIGNKTRIDGFVHAAGIEKTIPLVSMKSADFIELYKLNVVGGLELAGIFSKKKYVSNHASFVFISSITSMIGRAGLVGYSASKGALVSAVKSMAIELANKNINVNCISPGTVLTPMILKYLQSLGPEEQEKRKQNFPLGLGKPEDVAYSCVFLLSDSARWITGTNLVVDGGYTAK